MYDQAEVRDTIGRAKLVCEVAEQLLARLALERDGQPLLRLVVDNKEPDDA
jgi:hypothetical protein